MERVFETVALYGIVPVINVPNPQVAAPLAAALIEGGLPLIEVTLRNETSIESMACIKKTYPEMIVGAGTVRSTALVDSAIAAGADFVVTPGFNPTVVAYCIEKGMPVLPGCVTATEMESGFAMGLNVFKFFPSEQLGGVKTMKELSGPYPDAKFVATSGITMKNLPEYMSCDAVAAIGGSFVAPADMILAGDWDGITEKCRQAVRVALGFHIAHVGLNGADEAEGRARAQRFAEIFDMPHKMGGRSDFAGTVLESTKMKFPGEKGHIAIGTNSVDRAVYFLARKGITMRDEFVNLNATGGLQAVYLTEEVGGFAIHLLRTK